MYLCPEVQSAKNIRFGCSENVLYRTVVPVPRTFFERSRSGLGPRFLFNPSICGWNFLS